MKDYIALGAAFAALSISIGTYLFPEGNEVEPVNLTDLVVLNHELNIVKSQNEQLIKTVEAMEVRQAVVSSTLPIALSEDDSEVYNRISSLEDSVEKLSSANVQDQLVARAEGVPRNTWSEKHSRSTGQEYRSSETGETAFYGDSGDSLSHHSDTIRSSLESEDSGIELHDLECLESVCKVTFNALPHGDENFGRSVEVADALSDNINGGEIEIHYGRDESGGEVAYIQVHD